MLFRRKCELNISCQVSELVRSPSDVRPTLRHFDVEGDTASLPRPMDHVRRLHLHAVESLLECPTSVLKVTGHSEAVSCRSLVHWRYKVYWSGVVLHAFPDMQQLRSERLFTTAQSCLLATCGSAHPLLPRRNYMIVVLLRMIFTVKLVLAYPLENT